MGRADENDIVLSGDLVSRKHARITVQGDLLTVEDLGSRNGTFLNGAPLPGVSMVAHGDELRVGTVTLMVHLSTGRTPTRAVDAGA
jgi:pSer/pThr/pTyr-binding forkhead associated (FHA) protein